MSVYFVQAGDGGRIKIGYAQSPDQRIAFLRRFSGPDLVVRAVIEGERGVEYALHQHLSAHRAHGEWFEPDGEVLEICRRAAALPQDDGCLKERFRADFNLEQLKELHEMGGVIGKAAHVAYGCAGSYSFGVLFQLVRLLTDEEFSEAA